ncbi:MAG: hypothetical protein LBQ91_04345 [Oscillospiraceae bacterium]|jgi:hypothetical protein|nr:hypothetical protein [Oscillospiraceae bacterium]
MKPLKMEGFESGQDDKDIFSDGYTTNTGDKINRDLFGTGYFMSNKRGCFVSVLSLMAVIILLVVLCLYKSLWRLIALKAVLFAGIAK